MRDSRASMLVGGLVPALLILVGMPLVANSDVTVGGVPLLLAYMFLLFPVTTVCLWCAWRIDAHRYDQPEPSRRGEVV